MVAAAAHPLKRSKSADAIASGCRLLICMSMECVCASQLRHFVHAPILAELLDLAQQILCGNFPCPSDRQPSPGAEGKTSSQVCGEGLRAVDRNIVAVSTSSSACTLFFLPPPRPIIDAGPPRRQCTDPCAGRRVCESDPIRPPQRGHHRCWNAAFP